MTAAKYCPRCGSTEGAQNWENSEIVSRGKITKVQTGRCSCGCIVERAERNVGPASTYKRD